MKVNPTLAQGTLVTLATPAQKLFFYIGFSAQNRSKRLYQAIGVHFHLVSSKMVDSRPISSQISYFLGKQFSENPTFFENMDLRWLLGPKCQVKKLHILIL